MKKILLSFALLLAGVAVNGQTVSKLMKKYKNKPGAELINIDKNMMKLAKLGGGMFGFGKNEFSFEIQITLGNSDPTSFLSFGSIAILNN